MFIKSVGDLQVACRDSEATCKQSEVLPLAMDMGIPMQSALQPWTWCAVGRDGAGVPPQRRASGLMLSCLAQVHKLA